MKRAVLVVLVAMVCLLLGCSPETPSSQPSPKSDRAGLEPSVDATGALVGNWTALETYPVVGLEFLADGKLTQSIQESDGTLSKSFGRWRVVTPGRIECNQTRLGFPNAVALYDYTLEQGVLTLTWVDEKGAAPEPGVRIAWLAGTNYPTFSLER